jgi:hypothetical protein
MNFIISTATSSLLRAGALAASPFDSLSAIGHPPVC